MNTLDRLINAAHDWLDALQPNHRRAPHRRVPPEEFWGSIPVSVEDYMVALDADVNPYDNEIFRVPTNAEFVQHLREEREAEEDARVAARAAARRETVRTTPGVLDKLSDELWGA